MRREISFVSVGEQGKAMAPGQPPGEKCSPDTDNIQFLPCEMQKSILTSAKLFYHPVSDPASLIVLLHTLTRKRPLPSKSNLCKKGGRS